MCDLPIVPMSTWSVYHSIYKITEMKTNKFLSYVYIIDLILVSLWALFALCNPVSECILVFPVILIRLTTVFWLQFTERKAWIPIFLFTFVALSTLGFRSYDYNDLVLRPFARMYDYIIMLIDRQSSLLEGAYHYLGNHGDSVPSPGLCWWIFVYGYIAWLVFAPVVIYSYLWATKKLKPSKWNLKRISYIAFAYVSSCAAVLGVNECDETILPGALRSWGLAILLIPLIVGIRWQPLSLWCRRYILIALLFFIAIIAGIYMQSIGSLLAIIISVPMFYYFVGYKWIAKETTGLWLNLYVLLLSGVIFWTAQYAIDLSRIALLIASIGIVGYVAYQMWHNTRRLTKSVTIFIVGAFILPSIALGYNQFTCIGAKRLYNYTEYDYSYRGLLKVKSFNGDAIRDRFGYITPIEYEQIESMGNSSKPFVKFKHEGFWGVYDLECQSVVVEPKYNDILPYDKNSWRLMDEFCVRYGCHDFFVSSGYYYRYDECGNTSDCPFIHGLENVLPLKYDCEVRGAKYIDYILTEMMTKLWQKSDSVSFADFYYDWTCEVNEIIENLQSKIDVFDDNGDITDEAMLKLEEYIDPGCGGSQMAMNATSYVLSAMENYRMVQSVQDLEYRLSPIDMRHEYTLFNELMSAYEDWEAKRDEFKNWYSDRPREKNMELRARFMDRRKSIDDFRAVVKGDTIIPFTPVYPRNSIDRYFDNLADIGYPETGELVKPIRTSFKKWIEYRYQIAAQMPKRIATSYRNQTRQLEKFYTSDDFLYEDEL